MTNFTAVQTAEGTLVISTVATVTFGSPVTSGVPIRYAYVTVTNDSGTTPAPIYFTINGVAPTVGGEDTIEVLPNTSVTVANGEPYWTQVANVLAKGTVVGAQGTGTPPEIQPYGSSLYAGTVSPGTQVQLISAQAMNYTVSGTG